MFDRFSNSARSVVFRARDIAQSEGQGFVGPDHILLALVELHPQLFEGLSSRAIDLQSIHREVAQSTTSNASSETAKLRFSEQSKRV